MFLRRLLVRRSSKKQPSDRSIVTSIGNTTLKRLDHIFCRLLDQEGDSPSKLYRRVTDTTESARAEICGLNLLIRDKRVTFDTSEKRDKILDLIQQINAKLDEIEKMQNFEFDSQWAHQYYQTIRDFGATIDAYDSRPREHYPPDGKMEYYDDEPNALLSKTNTSYTSPSAPSE